MRTVDRQKRVDEFYELLSTAQKKFRMRLLEDLNRNIKLPTHGVYFFFDENQRRINGELRVIRIGTHAARINSKATLYRRLRQHQGTIKNKLGNHRLSVFRELVGLSLMETSGIVINSWGQKKNKTGLEVDIEREVTSYLSKQLFMVVEVPGESFKDNDRAFIEKNAIGLLSNYQREEIDPVNSLWLGKSSGIYKVSQSGLWNSDHVDFKDLNNFLPRLQRYVEHMKHY